MRYTGAGSILLHALFSGAGLSVDFTRAGLFYSYAPAAAAVAVASTGPTTGVETCWFAIGDSQTPLM